MIRPPRARRAVAAVEFALVAPVLFGLLLGVWEIGRVIQVQQMLSASAREGGRIAAQGWTISIQNGTQQVTTQPSSSTTIDVYDTVKNFLTQAGLDTTGLQVQLSFVTGNTSLTDPYQASKGQQFKVTVTLPYQNVAWSPINLTGGANLTASTVWASVVDDPFQIDTTIPQ
jgi:Flp pilus assembly protein TadG